MLKELELQIAMSFALVPNKNVAVPEQIAYTTYMKIKQKLVKEIAVNKNDLKQHVCNVYADILQDSSDEPELMQSSAYDFTTIMQSIEAGKLKHQCEQGFTMVIFSDEVADEIENFFLDLRTNGHVNSQEHIKELNINVVDDEGDVLETIGMDYLQF